MWGKLLGQVYSFLRAVSVECVTQALWLCLAKKICNHLWIVNFTYLSTEDIHFSSSQTQHFPDLQTRIEINQTPYKCVKDE